MGVDAGKIIDIIGANPGLLEKVIDLIGRLFKKKPKPPDVPVTQPVPSPAPQDEDFPDDIIPVPVGQRKVARVKVRLSRVQLPKSRFPESYTPDNPFGLVKPGPIMDGSSAMNWGSKFWTDLTAYDQEGKEFLPEAVAAYGLAYKTEVRVTSDDGSETYIIGKGADAEGNPVAGYVTESSEQIGNGISAWISTKGFLHQFKSWPASDGHTYEVTGKVDGVDAEGFHFKIS